MNKLDIEAIVYIRSQLYYNDKIEVKDIPALLEAYTYCCSGSIINNLKYAHTDMIDYVCTAHRSYTKNNTFQSFKHIIRDINQRGKASIVIL